MLKKMMEKRNQKGFTLMEMLIVVAIIAILVAIAIPVFSTQLEKARESSDAANIRAAYAEVMTSFIDGAAVDGVTESTSNEDEYYKEVTLQQKKAGWQTKDIASNGIGGMDGSNGDSNKPYANGKATVYVSGTSDAWVVYEGVND